MHSDNHQTFFLKPKKPSVQDLKDFAENVLPTLPSLHIKEVFSRKEKFRKEVSNIEKQILVTMLKASEDPIDIAIYSKMLFMKSLSDDYSSAFCSTMQEVEIYKYMFKGSDGPLEYNQTLVADFQSLFCFIPSEAFSVSLLLEDNLEEQFKKFKEERVDVRSRLKKLLPTLKKVKIKSVTQIIENNRKLVKEYFEMYLHHHAALELLCKTSDIDVENLKTRQQKLIVNFYLDVYRSPEITKNSIINSYLEKKYKLSGQSMRLTEGKLSESGFAAMFKELFFPVENAKSKADISYIYTLYSQIEEKNLAVNMPKLSSSSATTDPWDLDKFKQAFNTRTISEDNIFKNLWNACKDDTHRYPHVEFILNRVLKPGQAKKLINQVPSTKKLTLFQHAVQQGAIKIVRLFLHKCDVEMENLQKALTLTSAIEIITLIKDKMPLTEKTLKISPIEEILTTKEPASSQPKIITGNMKLQLKQVQDQQRQLKELITSFRVQIDICQDQLKELPKFAKLVQEFKEIEDNFAHAKQAFDKLEDPISLDCLKEFNHIFLQQMQCIQNKKIAANLSRMQKQIKQMEPIAPIEKEKKAKQKKTIVVAKKSDSLFWMEKKQMRLAKILRFCGYKTENTLNQHLQHNALLFEIMQYMEIQKNYSLPAGYVDEICKQLGHHAVVMIRNALVHSFSFLETRFDDEFKRDLTETIEFARELVRAVNKQEFADLKKLPFFKKAIRRGHELTKKIDTISNLKSQIEHILYVGAQQLQFATVEESSLPNGMRKSALNMCQVRMQKYFKTISLTGVESSTVNTLTHLGPIPGAVDSDDNVVQEIVAEQLRTTWSP